MPKQGNVRRAESAKKLYIFKTGLDRQTRSVFNKSEAFLLSTPFRTKATRAPA